MSLESLLRPIIHVGCFNSVEIVLDKSRSNTTEGTLFVFCVGEVIIVILDL